MIIIIGLTISIILVYLAYPLWLYCLRPLSEDKSADTCSVDSVSVVLLSYNGGKYLKSKIGFLLRELDVFKHAELIVFDDKSEDGSREILKDFMEDKRVRIILQEDHRGIPNSMKRAVEEAKYNVIVFCDQRQVLSEKIIAKLVEPLKNEKIGAISACISEFDKSNRRSWLRTYENHIKRLESRTGCLIGVYGPLFAIRKNSFTAIPDHIRLDDLYLSLKILASRQVRIMKECLIIDESPSLLNDYQRAKRYVSGFLQLLNEPGLIRQLSLKQRTMLFWHKYLRLHIPLLILASYAGMGISSIFNSSFLLPFALITLVLFLLSLPVKINFRLRLGNLVRINLYYLVAFIEVNATHYFHLRKLN